MKSEVMFGSKVVLNDDRVGIVKYVGEMDFTEGLWYGIELVTSFITLDESRHFKRGSSTVRPSN